MRAILPHTIQSQTFEVEVAGSEADALALQRQLAGLSAALMPVIEQALDRHAPDHGVLRIDRLEVDAGRIPLARFEQELPAVLRRALEEALGARISSAPREQSGARHVGLTQAMDEALAYFLRYATLPASVPLPAGLDFEQMLLDAWRDAATPSADARLSASLSSAASSAGLPSVSPALMAALRSRQALDRLGRQFSPAFQQLLVARLTPTLAPTLQAALQYLRTQEQGVLLLAAERLLCRAALELALDDRATVDALPVQEALWRGLPERAARVALAVARQANVEKRPVAMLLKTGPAAADAQRAAGAATRPSAGEGAEHPDAQRGIYIDNAGLVLLHPFLPALFEELGLARDDQLLQPERALAVLHFLASGQPQAPEYALALPKLLCHLPLTANATSDVVLHAAEQAEANALLKAVIGHWSALRDTGPDGLRGAFLLRPGKLSERAGEWLLQVERHTADILLGDLPWGYSAIRLPWMSGILWVEWN